MKVYLYRVDRRTNEFQKYQGELVGHMYDGLFIPEGERFARYSVSNTPGEVKGGNVWFFEANEEAAAAALTAYFEEKIEKNKNALANLEDKIDILRRAI